MKTIEEIEKLSLEELEGIAEKGDVAVPHALEDAVRSAVLASAVNGKAARKSAGMRRSWIAGSAFAAVAAAAAIVVAVPSRPKDTFSDPLLAYAEVEKTLSYISSKMDKGLDMVGEIEPAMEKPAQIINKINHD